MLATSSRSALIPSGLLAGPANFACRMCRPRYSTGKATQIIVGCSFEDFNILASAAGSSKSPFAQGLAAAASPDTGVIVTATHKVIGKIMRVCLLYDDTQPVANL